MTLHEMAESALKMVAKAPFYGFDAKNVQIKSVQFTRCGNDSIDIYESDGQIFADVYFWLG